jgi:hypothetical protein
VTREPSADLVDDSGSELRWVGTIGGQLHRPHVSGLGECPIA